MKLTVKNIIEIMSYGYFSFPVFNYLMEDPENQIFMGFINYQKESWNGNHLKSLELLNRQIELVEKTLKVKEIIKTDPVCEIDFDASLNRLCSYSFYYLLLALKVDTLISIFRQLNNEIYKNEASDIYKFLIENFNKVPEYLRSSIFTTLNHLSPYLTNENIPELNLTSDIYKQDTGYSFHLYGLARTHGIRAREFFELGKAELAGEETDKCIKLAEEGIEHSNKYPHPSGIISGHNKLAWYSRNIYKDYSLDRSKDLAYVIGYYFENLSYNYNEIDTIFDVCKLNKSTDIFFISNIMNFAYKFFKSERTETTRDKMDLVRKHVFKLNKESYSNTQILRSYIKKTVQDKKIPGVNVRMLNSFLSGKSEEVEGGFLRSIIKQTISGVDMNTPLPVAAEFFKYKILESLENHKNDFVSLSENDKIINFLSVYTSFFEKESTLTSDILNLMVSDTEKFISDITSNNDFFLMGCISSVYDEPYPFFKAHMDLAGRFFGHLGSVNTLKSFTDFYLSFDAEKKMFFDEFIRNYSRYSIISWKMNFAVSPEMKVFVKRFKLNKNLAMISVNAFDEERKEEFITILNDHIKK